MLDRTRPPAIYHIDRLHLPQPLLHYLDNGIPVYDTRINTQDVLKIELVFQAGRPQESKKLVARATAGLLKDGAGELDGAAIAEAIDFYGGTLNIPSGMDGVNLVFYCLSKHLPSVLPVLSEIILKPTFPQHELEAYVQRHLQNLKIDLSKPDIVAYRNITEMIFGESHPYGYNSLPEHYAALTREDLQAHHQAWYHSGNCMIFICGKTDDQTVRLLNQYFGKMPAGISAGVPFFPAPPEKPLPKKHFPHAEAVQTAVYIGRRMFPRNHPDYCGMYVLNTLLGGYFGSRLMTNIREEKGYTYNILSMLDTMQTDGWFYVGTEVGNEFTGRTITEIYSEMEMLRKEPVDKEEMDMVRNYLMGGFLTMIDGPFNVSEVVRTLITESLPLDFFEQWVNKVANITPDELQALAKKYLDPADMWEVAVGG
ncbi:MAG: insulinase family protein [Saprospiraceae bacterium]|nr:insulinase family protein [Saprospiraceae bacterium]